MTIYEITSSVLSHKFIDYLENLGNRSLPVAALIYQAVTEPRPEGSGQQLVLRTSDSGH